MKSKSGDLYSLQGEKGYNNDTSQICIQNCHECSDRIENKISQDKCITSILKRLYLSRNKDLKISKLRINDNIINTDQIKILFNYFKQIKTIIRIWKKIKNVRKINCLYQEFNCRVESIYQKINPFDQNKLFDPILVFNYVNEKVNELTLYTSFNMECQKCSLQILELLKEILDILGKLEVIQYFNEFQRRNNHSKDLIQFYKKYFFNFTLDSKNTQLTNKSPISSQAEVLESYFTGEYQIFQIVISNVIGEYEKKYSFQYAYESQVDENYFKTIVNDARNNLSLIEFNEIVPLEQLIEVYKEKVLVFLDLKYKISYKEQEKIAYIAALHKINLEKIFPLLIDDTIEEIFLDSPNEKIYINHQKYGRCRTDINFNLEDIERLKTFLRVYSGKRLDYSNPSIKVVLKNKYFYCRFAVDIGPIQVNNFALDVRKLNKNILTIQDLLKNGTLSPDIASFLYILILRRINITVTGETDTGKTTLINALDLLAPKEFRKIYVENVIESLNQSKFERHQLKYKVDSLDDQLNHQISKQTQIKKLLHRTPDIIYLGEILTKNEAEALFHCLSAGLRGFQTIHSNSINSLINRIIYHFNINKTCLQDLGIIILMKKNREKRFIDTITEINDNLTDSSEVYSDLFKHNPQLRKWDVLCDLFESNTVKSIRNHEDFLRDKYYNLFSLYRDVFDTLRKMKKIKILEQVKLFDKISFQSYNNIDTLRLFWDNWKNSCSLNC